MAPKAQVVRHKTPSLPPIVTSPTDVGRLKNELELIDNALLQLSIRHGGKEVKVPKTSRLMDLCVEHNKLNLLQAADRTVLKQYLEIVLNRAPRLHFSFSADPSVSFMEKLMTWLRQEIHPHVLVTVGLQPNIGAGCMVRSTNKYFDFSLGQTFIKNRDLLRTKLVAGPGEVAK